MALKSVDYYYYYYYYYYHYCYFDPSTQFPGNEKIRYAIEKSTKIKLE